MQRDLFADPKQSYREAVRFYKHDVDWANRLILGDSLQVMSSLAKREGLAAKVQMVYIDPPYGIKFRSNFQNEVGNRNVKEGESDLSRSPEVVSAYRDTWTLGIHSYLAFLRNRLLSARELLAESGSVFVQIGNDNAAVVRDLMDEVFGASNRISMIVFRKTTGAGSPSGNVKGLPETYDLLHWYAKDKARARINVLYQARDVADDPNFRLMRGPDGEIESVPIEGLLEGWRIFQPNPITAQTGGETTTFPVELDGQTFAPRKGGWKTNADGMRRLKVAGRLIGIGSTLRYIRYHNDFPYVPILDIWDDTRQSGFGEEKHYVVQTAPRVVERCMLLCTGPGDLVLDPTCGSGTTAVVAEKWGRRWIAVDTSRVAIQVARTRLMTASFPYYELSRPNGSPSGGFVSHQVPHIYLRDIARNDHLDMIDEKFRESMSNALERCNAALRSVSTDCRALLRRKLESKVSTTGRRSVTNGDRLTWELPSIKFEHWTVPHRTDSDWPSALIEAVLRYRTVCRTRQQAIDESILSNSTTEDLVDQPAEAAGIVRVSGPFTVEGVRPEELSLGEDGVFDPTPNEFVDADADGPNHSQGNLSAYLGQMVRLISKDGVTFTGNKHQHFARVTPLYDAGTPTALHAEGLWDGASDDQPDNVAIAFGPQYGPVTAVQVEDLVRASRRYDELVIAGFSFTAEATATIQESTNPRLRIHQAYIRPDVNPGMDGLLKDTPGSQLFSVFGLPEIAVRKGKDGWVAELKGVDIYDPVQNTVRSTGAKKVAAWFLDQDFDGRCFCISQAFFPDQDAWEKIAKALKGHVETDAFERFNGTVSVPFEAGEHKRIAVKVIDPRGNEVMAIHPLKG